MKYTAIIPASDREDYMLDRRGEETVLSLIQKQLDGDLNCRQIIITFNADILKAVRSGFVSGKTVLCNAQISGDVMADALLACCQNDVVIVDSYLEKLPAALKNSDPRKGLAYMKDGEIIARQYPVNLLSEKLRKREKYDYVRTIDL